MIREPLARAMRETKPKAVTPVRAAALTASIAASRRPGSWRLRSAHRQAQALPGPRPPLRDARSGRLPRHLEAKPQPPAGGPEDRSAGREARLRPSLVAVAARGATLPVAKRRADQARRASGSADDTRATSRRIGQALGRPCARARRGGDAEAESGLGGRRSTRASTEGPFSTRHADRGPARPRRS
jgi:hypothetical protein